jgi:hypothetical protein
MHEEELRALIRAAIEQHLGPSAMGRVGTTGPSSALSEGRAGSPGRAFAAPASWKTHLSHGRFVYLAPTDPDAPCVVEPQVRCHHCGFCQSYGH